MTKCNDDLGDTGKGAGEAGVFSFSLMSVLDSGRLKRKLNQLNEAFVGFFSKHLNSQTQRIVDCQFIHVLKPLGLKSSGLLWGKGRWL